MCWEAGAGRAEGLWLEVEDWLMESPWLAGVPWLEVEASGEGLYQRPLIGPC